MHQVYKVGVRPYNNQARSLFKEARVQYCFTLFSFTCKAWACLIEAAYQTRVVLCTPASCRQGT